MYGAELVQAGAFSSYSFWLHSTNRAGTRRGLNGFAVLICAVEILIDFKEFAALRFTYKNST